MRYNKIIISFFIAGRRYHRVLEIRHDLNLVYVGCIMKDFLHIDIEKSFVFKDKTNIYAPDSVYLDGKSGMVPMKEFILKDLDREFEFLCGENDRYSCQKFRQVMRKSDAVAFRMDRMAKDGQIREEQVSEKKNREFVDEAIAYINRYLAIQHEQGLETEVGMISRTVAKTEETSGTMLWDVNADDTGNVMLAEKFTDKCLDVYWQITKLLPLYARMYPEEDEETRMKRIREKVFLSCMDFVKRSVPDRKNRRNNALN